MDQGADTAFIYSTGPPAAQLSKPRAFSLMFGSSQFRVLHDRYEEYQGNLLQEGCALGTCPQV